MNRPSGYNPMRWDCEKRGCFNLKQRPKIEEFAACFPGNINFGDLDGIVEINSMGLILEWKGAPMDLPMGQRIMYDRLTVGQRMTTICVAGDPETMDVTHYAIIFDGKQGDWTPATMDEVKRRMCAWTRWAQEHERAV